MERIRDVKTDYPTRCCGSRIIIDKREMRRYDEIGDTTTYKVL